LKAHRRKAKMEFYTIFTMHYKMEDFIKHNFYCIPDVYTVHPEDGHRSDWNM
jgi:hypothetical protein